MPSDIFSVISIYVITGYTDMRKSIDYLYQVWHKPSCKRNPLTDAENFTGGPRQDLKKSKKRGKLLSIGRPYGMSCEIAKLSCHPWNCSFAKVKSMIKGNPRGCNDKLKNKKGLTHRVRYMV